MIMLNKAWIRSCTLCSLWTGSKMDPFSFVHRFARTSSRRDSTLETAFSDLWDGDTSRESRALRKRSLVNPKNSESSLPNSTFKHQQSNNSRPSKRPSSSFNKYDKSKSSAHDQLADVCSSRKAQKESQVIKEARVTYDVNQENQFEILNKVMCPYHVINYADQLRLKHKEVKLNLKEYGKKLAQFDETVAKDKEGIPCYYEFIQQSRTPIHYRNMDEFSIRAGVDNSKTVGYFVPQTPILNPSSNPSSSSSSSMTKSKKDANQSPKMVCVNPQQLIICKPSHQRLATEFQNYLLQQSPFEVCERFDEGGNWRNFIVKSSVDNRHMCIAKLHPQNLNENQLKEEMDRIHHHFQPLAEELAIDSFYFQSTTTHRSVNEAPTSYRLLFGQSHIVERMSDGTKKKMTDYLIGPDCHLIPNADALQSMRFLLEDHIRLSPTANLIEWNCGAGFLTTSLAPLVSRVCSLESNATIANDCRHNLLKAGIRNVTVYDGDGMNNLLRLCDQMYESTTVLLGLGNSAINHQMIQVLRECRHVEKVILMTTRLDQKSIKSLLHLTLPGGNDTQLNGTAFFPVQVSPVDVFPQTLNYCTIVTLERAK